MRQVSELVCFHLSDKGSERKDRFSPRYYFPVFRSDQAWQNTWPRRERRDRSRATQSRRGLGAEHFQSLSRKNIYSSCKGAIISKHQVKKSSGRLFKKDEPLPTVNYKYEKRQKELEKKKKKAEKTRLKENKRIIRPEEKPVPPAEK